VDRLRNNLTFLTTPDWIYSDFIFQVV
jgi:hypothetical protein